MKILSYCSEAVDMITEEQKRDRFYPICVPASRHKLEVVFKRPKKTIIFLCVLGEIF